MYHNLGEPPADAKLRGLYVRTGAFATQMRLLKLLGYRGLSMSAAMPYLRGEKRGRVVAITFDDGYVDTLENALPILQKHNFSATCYVVSQRIGQFNDWDAAAVNVRKPLMNDAQLRAWQAGGMEIGAHTQTHPHLPLCDDEQLANEITQCRVELSARIGQPVSQFCYPYGDYDARSVAAVATAGYDAATTVQRGRAISGSNPLQLCRIVVSGSTLPHLFLMKLFSKYEDKRG